MKFIKTTRDLTRADDLDEDQTSVVIGAALLELEPPVDIKPGMPRRLPKGTASPR